MTPDMMVVTDFDGQEARRRSRRLVRAEDAPAGVSRSAGRARGGPRASAHGDGLCRRRHSARSRGARRGRHDARQHSDRRVRHAVDRRTAGGVQQVPESARRPAARQSRRAGDRARSVHGVSPDGDDRALREDQPGDAACSDARTCCRARKSHRLQGLRGMYGIASPAPVCTDDIDGGRCRTARSHVRWSRRRVARRRAAGGRYSIVAAWRLAVRSRS